SFTKLPIPMLWLFPTMATAMAGLKYEFGGEVSHIKFGAPFGSEEYAMLLLYLFCCIFYELAYPENCTLLLNGGCQDISALIRNERYRVSMGEELVMGDTVWLSARATNSCVLLLQIEYRHSSGGIVCFLVLFIEFLV
ncbi:hypothetical protein Dimus_008013, partial [Dionaea muscipula]